MPREARMSEQQINIEFVKEVQKHPTLYNFQLPTYSRKDVSDRAWEEVGKATSMTPSACRERWRNLRAVFMRTVRAPTNGSGRKKPYYLSEVMQFVLPYVRPTSLQGGRSEQGTDKESEPDEHIVKIEKSSDEESDHLSIQSFEDVKPVLKRPKEDEDEGQQYVKVPRPSQEFTGHSVTGAEPVTSFLNSLLPELHEMNSTQFKNFKRRVLVLIDDIMTETF